MQKTIAARLADARQALSNTRWLFSLSRAIGFQQARALVKAITRCGSATAKALATARTFVVLLLAALFDIDALRELARTLYYLLPPPLPQIDGVQIEVTPRLLPLPAACRA